MLNSPIEEIKSRLNIVDVIGSYIKLTKAGANYKAVCPFHSEKTPSFFVSPARQMWHCFGCGAGHSMFDFVMKIEGVEFGDALRILAQKAGVELKSVRPEVRTKRQRVYEICDLAAKFFETQLQKSAVGKKSKQYLLGRTISEESIKKWRLGWAPDKWRGLSDFLISQGYKKDEIVRAGLALRGDGGKFFDRFRGRIMFPVFDFNSQIIGFGGRVLKKSKDTAKYINSPSTVLYDKGKILYGLDKAKVEIRKKDFCIMVEGYVDVILAHQSGIENTVATSGTALGSYQLDILKRYSDNLSLAFDMDFAGDKATKRGIELAQVRGFNIKILLLPEGRDPADVMADNPKQFAEIIDKGVSILEFYFQDAFSKFDEKKPEGKRKISNALLPVVKRIPNKIEQSFWVQKLAAKLEVKERDVEEELGKVKTEEAADIEIDAAASPNPVLARSRQELLEERVISLVAKSPEAWEQLDKEKFSFCSPKIKEIVTNFKDRENFSRETKELLDCLYLKAEMEELKDKEVVPEINFCLAEIKSLKVKKKLNEISLQIKKAEEEKNNEETEKLIKEFDQLSKKIITE